VGPSTETGSDAGGIAQEKTFRTRRKFEIKSQKSLSTYTAFVRNIPQIEMPRVLAIKIIHVKYVGGRKAI
jgi:hypothetical protein